jgi:hypothetical protein
LPYQRGFLATKAFFLAKTMPAIAISAIQWSATGIKTGANRNGFIALPG